MSSFADRTRDLGRLLWRKAKQSGETAADLLEQQAQLQRLAGQIRKAERERKALFGQIGLKVYALHSQGKVRNHDVLGLCHELDALAAEIARLKQQIEDLRTASLAQGHKMPELEDLTALTEENDETAPAPAAAPEPEAAGANTPGLETETATGPAGAALAKDDEQAATQTNQ